MNKPKTIEEFKKRVEVLENENRRLMRDNIQLAGMVAHRSARLALARWFLRIPGSRWLFLRGF